MHSDRSRLEIVGHGRRGAARRPGPLARPLGKASAPGMYMRRSPPGFMVSSPSSRPATICPGQG